MMPPKKSTVTTRSTRSHEKTGVGEEQRKVGRRDDVEDDEDDDGGVADGDDGFEESEGETDGEGEDEFDDGGDDGIEENEKDEQDSQSKKRKTPPTDASSKRKAAKPRPPPSNSKSEDSPKQSSSSSRIPSTKQLLNFLLSSSSLPHCFPAEDLEFGHSNRTLRSYSLTSPSEFTPFEHLLSAHLLSKPLSHVLGMRSIRTLLNPPFGFNSAEEVVKVGEERVWEALEQARTQHRQKTAGYVIGMAREFVDEGGREVLFELSEIANEEGADGVVEFVEKNIKGMGKVGGQVFCRRIQCVDGWGDAVWPYVDDKAMDALREVGIDVENAEELQGLIEREVDWKLVGDMGLNERGLAKGELAGEEIEVLVQTEFVVVVERALGAVLQGNVKALRDEAAKL